MLLVLAWDVQAFLFRSHHTSLPRTTQPIPNEAHEAHFSQNIDIELFGLNRMLTIKQIIQTELAININMKFDFITFAIFIQEYYKDPPSQTRDHQ